MVATGYERTVVVDVGSSSVKAGFSGEDIPRAVFPAVAEDLDLSSEELSTYRARRPESRDCQAEYKPSGIDDMAEKTVDPKHPVRRGIMRDVDEMEKLMDNIFNFELGFTGIHTPVLMVEPPLNDRSQRQEMAAMMFETFKVPALSTCNSSVLALFASGRTRGLVVEAGGGVSHVVPVFEGFALNHATLKLEGAGQDITHRLSVMLAEQGRTLAGLSSWGALPVVKDRVTSQNSSVKDSSVNFIAEDGWVSMFCPEVVTIAIKWGTPVRDIKEKLCYLPTLTGVTASDDEYELPDGTTIALNEKCRSQAAELLFNPNVVGDGAFESGARDGGLASMVMRSVSMCDEDIKSDLLGSVVVAGGTTVMPGFVERLKEEVDRASPPTPSFSATIVPSPTAHEPGYNAQRKHAPWIGGSILASLPPFKELQVTRQEYEDSGDGIIQRKLL